MGITDPKGTTVPAGAAVAARPSLPNVASASPLPALLLRRLTYSVQSSAPSSPSMHRATSSADRPKQSGPLIE